MSNKEKYGDKKEHMKEEKLENQEMQEPLETESVQPETEATEADKVQELGQKLTELNDKYLRLYFSRGRVCHCFRGEL